MRYKGKIKVVCIDKMCYPVDPKTMEPAAVSYYDTCPYHEPHAVEIISHSEYLRRKHDEQDVIS